MLTYIGCFVAIHVFDLLAPHFASEKNLPKSAQLVGYALTPGFIATFLSFLPSMGGLIGAAAWVYSIYPYRVGLLKKTPEDEGRLSGRGTGRDDRGFPRRQRPPRPGWVQPGRDRAVIQRTETRRATGVTASTARSSVGQCSAFPVSCPPPQVFKR